MRPLFFLVQGPAVFGCPVRKKGTLAEFLRVLVTDDQCHGLQR